MTILLTAFEAFGGDSVNAALEAVNRVSAVVGDAQIVKRTLPVAFRQAPQCLEAAIAEVRPDALVMVGQAPRPAVCLERVALNLMRAKNSDNEGFRPGGIPVVAGGPTAYMTPVDVDTIAERLQAVGLPVQVSNTAGLYVCNTLYYNALHAHPELSPLFIHVPKSDTLSPDQSAEIIGAILELL